MRGLPASRVGDARLPAPSSNPGRATAGGLGGAASPPAPPGAARAGGGALAASAGRGGSGSAACGAAPSEEAAPPLCAPSASDGLRSPAGWPSGPALGAAGGGGGAARVCGAAAAAVGCAASPPAALAPLFTTAAQPPCLSGGAARLAASTGFGASAMRAIAPYQQRRAGHATQRGARLRRAFAVVATRRSSLFHPRERRDHAVRCCSATKKTVSAFHKDGLQLQKAPQV